MYRRTVHILISLLAVGLSACGTGRPIRYYTVQTPVAPTPSIDAYPVSLSVANVSAPEIFRDTPIAYRIGANEVGTYHYSRWAEPPVEMVHGKLVRMLRASGHYQSVTGPGSTSEGQFVLRGRLYAFEEVDSGSIDGLVSMEFELYDRKSGKIVWSHFYSNNEAVEGKKISEVVTALDLNLDRGLNEVAAGLGKFFSETLAKNY
ncbi:MAG TPA: ABC-type transport auxiliary lipoprotein family protein [Terriglobales bacterium]|jgi:ABC-type uncharacterized transport system auxiliary subunit|nr:ABC-type transport auxiliary lipoprotein family protein [Terriglobales bacterium]